MDRIDREGVFPAPVQDDDRATQRIALMLRAAKLIADDREFLCILRDASPRGVRLRLFHPLPPHNELALELGNGERLRIEQVCHNGNHARFRFAGETDVLRLIDDSAAAHPKRQLRLRIGLAALVHSGGIATPMTFRDISQQGACIESTRLLMLNELIRIEAPALPPIYAKVRWRRQPLYGLVFEHPFKLDELARMAAPLQEMRGCNGKSDRARTERTARQY